MIRLGTQKDVEEYFNRKAASQSFLKALLNGVDFINHNNEKELYYEEKGHFIIGSGADIQLTQGQIEFDKQYHQFRNKKPSAAIMSIVTKIFEDLSDGVEDMDSIVYPKLSDLENEILESCEYHDYSRKMLAPTKINKILKEGEDYYNELIESNGKQIISEIEGQIISNIVMSFKSHKHTSKYFQEGEGLDIFYQVPIYFSQNGVDCKVLLDKVIIDHNKKTIQPIDIKTMSGATRTFPVALRRFRYDIQASFYTLGLNTLLFGEGASTPVEGFEKVTAEYKMLPFKFIVETTDYKENKLTGDINYYQGTPLVYRLDNYVLEMGAKGRPELEVFADDDVSQDFPIVFKEVEGWTQALSLYKWYEENGYEYDKDVAKNNGELLITY